VAQHITEAVLGDVVARRKVYKLHAPWLHYLYLCRHAVSQTKYEARSEMQFNCMNVLLGGASDGRLTRRQVQQVVMVIRSLLEIDARHVPLTPRAIECTSTRCARGREPWFKCHAVNNAWANFSRARRGRCILHCESRCGKPTTAARSTVQACAKHVINARHRNQAAPQ